MCPLCISSAVLAVAGATSTSALSALAVARFTAIAKLQKIKQHKEQTHYVNDHDRSSENRISKRMGRSAAGTAGQREATDPARRRDQPAAPRATMVKVEKNYVFDGPDGKEKLADLFGGRS